jgi:hypothetical protein
MMDYADVQAAIECGAAADTVPGLALSVLRDIASGRRDLAAVRHPLGFLCFPAQRGSEYGVCVHLWTPGARHVLTTSQVHAHSWDLTSYVLYGTLRNQRMRVTDAPGSATHRVFEVRSHGDVDELHATSRLVVYQPEADCAYSAGSVYLVAAGEFHATVAPGGQDVATVVLSYTRREAADLALGPVHGGSHVLTRSRCGAAETARAASLIADRLAAAG